MNSALKAPPSLMGGAMVHILICAGISAICMQSGFLSLFFLIPLGYAAKVYGRISAWLTFFLAMLINALFTLGFVFFTGKSGDINFSSIGMSIFYYIVVAGAFTWMMIPGTNNGFFRIRTLYRFIAGALLSAGVLLFLMFASSQGLAFTEALRGQAEILSSLYVSSAGNDAVKKSFLEQALTVDKVMELMKMIAFRGGAVVSCFLLFFFSSSISGGIAGFRSRGSSAGKVISRASAGIAYFHAPFGTIWAFSAGLALVLFSRIFKIVTMETAAWNILAICAMIYLAQGAGIVLFTLARRKMTLVSRFLVNLLAVVIFLSPGINAFALAVLILLGIAENWLPLRAVKTNDSPSTPMV
jgi:hypothetical protein